MAALQMCHLLDAFEEIIDPARLEFDASTYRRTVRRLTADVTDQLQSGYGDPSAIRPDTPQFDGE